MSSVAEARRSGDQSILEIADVLVVNKADLDRSHVLVDDLRTMLSLGTAPRPGWTPPIVETVATEHRGMGDLLERIDQHWQYLVSSGARERRREDNARRRVQVLVEERFRERCDHLISRGGWSDRFSAIGRGEADPYSAAEALLQEVATCPRP
jgi:LAO/AO transport system kinase